MSAGATRVRLGPDDLMHAADIGRERSETLDIGRDPDDTGYHGSGSADGHILGVRGEIAVSTRYDLPLDTETYAAGDGGRDFEVVFEGERASLDVKTTSYSPADLLVRTTTTGADLYLLAEYDSRTVEVALVGLATREMVHAADIEQSKYGHMNHVVPRDDLRDVPAPDDLRAAREVVA